MGTAEKKVDKTAVELSKAVQRPEDKVVRMPEGNPNLELEGTQNWPEDRVEKVVEDRVDQNEVGKVDLQKEKIALLRLLQDKVLPDYCYLLLDKAQA